MITVERADSQRHSAGLPSERGLSVFVCFASEDESEARRIVQFLEGDGLRCWISARDVLPGDNYQEAIVRALEKAKAVVFLLSASSNKSREIQKELALADSFDKRVFPVRLSAIDPADALRYELATSQWVDFFANHDEGLRTLSITIRKVLADSESDGNIAESESAAAHAPAARLQPIVAQGSAQFEAIRVLLARHIGPVARIVIQKAAIEAGTRDCFCEKLAAHVHQPSDREEFLLAIRTQLLPNG